MTSDSGAMIIVSKTMAAPGDLMGCEINGQTAGELEKCGDRNSTRAYPAMVKSFLFGFTCASEGLCFIAFLDSPAPLGKSWETKKITSNTTIIHIILISVQAHFAKAVLTESPTLLHKYGRHTLLQPSYISHLCTPIPHLLLRRNSANLALRTPSLLVNRRLDPRGTLHVSPQCRRP